MRRFTALKNNLTKEKYRKNMLSLRVERDSLVEIEVEEASKMMLLFHRGVW